MALTALRARGPRASLPVSRPQSGEEAAPAALGEACASVGADVLQEQVTKRDSLDACKDG